MLVGGALPSALNQQDVQLELVVVDDASTDVTARRLEALRDPRVRVYRFDAPRGQAEARNTGIREARGDWIAFLDDDDLWSPRKLRSQLDRAVMAGASFVYTSAVLVGLDRQVKRVEPAPDAARVAELLLRHNVLGAGASTVLARTDIVRRVGGFDPRLNELCDWDLWIRLASASRAAACPEALVAYTIHPGNRRVVGDSDVEVELQYLFAKHHPRLAVDRLHFSRWVARGHLRRGESLRAARAYAAAGVAHRSPGNIIRAAAAVLGERPFQVYRRLRSRNARPVWLDLYTRTDAGAAAKPATPDE
jgi:glycosyltransferase involved in cell wall biosynthesis